MNDKSSPERNAAENSAEDGAFAARELWGLSLTDAMDRRLGHHLDSAVDEWAADDAQKGVDGSRMWGIHRGHFTEYDLDPGLWSYFGPDLRPPLDPRFLGCHRYEEMDRTHQNCLRLAFGEICVAWEKKELQITGIPVALPGLGPGRVEIARERLDAGRWAYVRAGDSLMFSDMNGVRVPEGYGAVRIDAPADMEAASESAQAAAPGNAQPEITDEAPLPAVNARKSRGRPTAKTSIASAFRQMVDDGLVNFGAPMTHTYDRIRKEIAPDGNMVGLGAEAIRTVISPIFKELKSARKSRP